MTTSTDPTATSTTAGRLPLRLRLSPALGEGALDGTWWPQSRDLPVELADLIDHFPVELGQVRRVVFSRPDWDTAPHRVRVARGMVKVGSYPHDDTHQVWLSMSTRAMIRLSVVDPSARSDQAEAEGYAEGRAEEPHEDATWTDVGGSWWDPHPVAPSERV